MRLLLLLLTIAGFSFASESNEASYAGPQVCARCHKNIADTQAKTAMANTWHGAVASVIPPKFEAKKTEGPDPALLYDVSRSAGGLEFSVSIPNSGKSVLPVEAMVGGSRHGLSFLQRIQSVDGIPLERSALIEARYACSNKGGLVLSPGFTVKKPADYADALGRVLSPGFERRCLTCHGQPGTLGAGQHGGVRCESCHGPAADHVSAFTGGSSSQKAVMPKVLRGAASTEICAQCHTGLSNESDPLPDDLLVSSQVPALRNSECFVQSGGNLGCTDCHNPHEDSPRVVETSEQTCLKCHSASNQPHAGICPVNTAGGCVTCHMPSIEKNSFRLTDHWIRVHPEARITVAQHAPNLASEIEPKREFLRIIVVENRNKAEAAIQRMSKGESFQDVARQMSMDPTASGGGFIGEMDLSQMDPKLAAAAAKLPYGGTSEAMDLGDRCVILHRLSRNFKWEADQLFQQASALKERGDWKSAADKDQQALEIYPYFLRGLVLMGTALGEAGNVQRAAEVLRFAVEAYPKDASAQFDLGLTLGKQPTDQIEAFRRAIELDPDMIAAYESLGAALYSAGQQQAAIDLFHKGLQVDPLSAILYYDLGLALRRQGDETAAQRALTLAAKLDPEIAMKTR